MRWCIRDVYGMVECKNEMITMPSTFSELSKNALYWQTIVEGHAQRQIDSISGKRNKYRI
jgi:hypothetical protein